MPSLSSRAVLIGVLVAMLAGVHGVVAAPSAVATDTTTRGGAASESSLGRPEESAPPESLPAAPAAVPVYLGDQRIFTVRAARRGLAPPARAAATRARLDAAVRDVETSADSVRMRRTSEGVEVHLGPHFLWTITHGDVEGMSVAELGKLVGDLPSRIREGILRERSQRSPTGILVAVLIALGITILAWVLLKLLIAGSRRWRKFLERIVPKYLGTFRIGTFDVLQRGQLARIVITILARVDLVVGVLLAYGYLTSLLSLFPQSRGWSWHLLAFARSELTHIGVAAADAIPGLLVVATIFVVFRWLTGLSDRFFDAVDAGAVRVGWVHQELARPTKRLMKILLWIVAVAIAYPYIPGSQSKGVQGISILLGLMVSLGSTGVVGNVIAGIVLTYTRSFKAGERVRIGEHVGDVVSLGTFATKLRTPRNEEITLPNGQVASQSIVNYSRLAGDAGLILHTQVTIGYDADWRTVHRLLIEAASHVEGIEREPTPWVFQRALNDSHISYEICGVTRRSHDQFLLYSRLHEEIQDAFARAGLEILSPAYHALRDANAQVLPQEPKGPRAAPGGFRVRPPQNA